MKVRPKLQAEGSRPMVKTPVCPLVSSYWAIKIVRAVRILRFVRLLTLITDASQVMIQQTGKELVANNGFESGRSDTDLSPVMERGVHDCLGRDLGLIDWWHRLRLFGQPAFDPIELRSVHSWHLYHRDAHP